MDKVTLSIILPLLHEVEIDEKLERLISHIGHYPYEIILVDDSSDDEFLSLKESLKSRQDVCLMKGNRAGKGAAVRKAALKSRGAVVFYMDADLRIPLNNIGLFMDLIFKQGYDLAVAERPFAKTSRAPLRWLCSLALLYIARFFVFHSTSIQDTQCGFKCFRGAALRNFARRQAIAGGMFDVEYLYMARLNKLRIARVPVFPLPEIRHSRIRVLRCLLRDVIDLMRIKIRGVMNGYEIGGGGKQ